jgi:hypothetical protein
MTEGGIKMEKETIFRIKEGDIEAFEQLYNEYI